MVSGVGNGSTYRMIPAIFRTEALRSGNPDRQRALAVGRSRAATVIGLAGAIDALAGYAVCLGATWWYYLRPEYAIAV